MFVETDDRLTWVFMALQMKDGPVSRSGDIGVFGYFSEDVVSNPAFSLRPSKASNNVVVQGHQWLGGCCPLRADSDHAWKELRLSLVACRPCHLSSSNS